MQAKRLGRMVAGCLVLVMAMCAAASAQTRPFEQLVPEDVNGFAVVRDCTAVAAKFKASPYAALLEEPEVKAFADQVLAAASEGLSELREFEETAGISLAAIASLPQGQFAWVTRQKMGASPMGPMAPPDMAVLILADVGAKSAEAAELLDRLMQVAAGHDDVEASEEEFNGHKILHVSFVPQPQDTGMTEEELSELNPELRKVMEEMAAEGSVAGPAFHAYANLEGSIAAISFGMNRTLLEQHLALRDGSGGRPLADLDIFKRSMARVDPDGDYHAFQSFQPMIDAFEQMAAMGGGPDVAGILDALGISALKCQSASATLEQEGISSISFVLVPAPRKGILKALVPSGKVNVKPPRFVGGDAAIYVGGYLDAPTLWAEIKAALQSFSPDSYTMVNMMVNNPQAPVQIESEIINNLGGHWFLYVPAEAYDPAGPTVNAIIAVELKDSAAVENALAKAFAMAAQGGPAVEKTTLMGSSVFRLPPIPVGMYGPELPPMSLIFTDGKLVLATSDGMARQAVENTTTLKESPLLAKSEFKASLGHLVAPPEDIFYVDLRAAGKWIYTLVQLARMQMSAFDPSSPVAGLQLPGYETIAKYLGVVMGTAKSDEEGFLSKSWIAYPSGQPD